MGIRCVPGVGEEAASRITEAIPSLFEMLKVAREWRRLSVEERENRKNVLQDLEIPVRGKKQSRRLGPVLSKRILNLFGSETGGEIIWAGQGGGVDEGSGGEAEEEED